MNALLETLARLQSASGAEGFLAILAVKGTLVLVGGFAAALCLRRAPAAARHLAWCATFAGLLLLPAASLWAPPMPLPFLPADAADAAGAVAERPIVRYSFGVELSDTVSARSEPSRVRQEATTASPPAPAAPWRALLPAAYLAGAGALLAYLLIGGLRAGRLRRGARRLDAEPGWRGLLASLREALGIRRTLAVESTDRITVPLAWGALRPTVLLPAAAETWNDDQRRDVLVHELAHVARHDWLSQLGARVVCALYWFHPLVWVAARRLVLEAERACDDRVLAAGSDSCEYADRLLKVAGAARGAREPSYAAVAMARRSDLATRIQAILDGRVRRGALRAAHAALLAGALLVPAGLLGAAQLAPAGLQAGPVGARVVSGGFGEEADSDRDRDEDDDREDRRRAEGDLPPLLEAAGRGDAGQVRRLVSSGADVEEAVAGRGTPLIRAAAGGHPEAVRILLDSGADPNRSETRGHWEREVARSPLGAAARSGSVEAAELLLDRGARVDLAPQGDASPLMIAAEHGHRALVRLLLARGADPNRTLEGDGSPMIAAVRSGDAEIVRRLLAAGAEPDVWVEGDESPLFHAIGGGDPEMVRLLLDAGADPGTEWPGDGSPIIMASAEGRHDLVELLIDSGADVDRVVPGDENPLIRAAGAGHLDVVRYLLDRGADPNMRTFEGPAPWRPEGELRTPLTQARRGGHDDVVRLLLARGARE